MPSIPPVNSIGSFDATMVIEQSAVNRPYATIIGSGIGGLTIAVALQRAGIPFTVFERAPELAECGAGITLWANAIAALARIDAADEICAAGEEVLSGELRRSDGRVLSRTPVQELSHRVGHPSIAIHRADLQSQLLRLLDPSAIHLNHPCVGVEQRNREVVAHFSNGTTHTSNLLIAADGVRSIIHQNLFGEAQFNYCGYVCYRGITQYESPLLHPGEAFESWGKGKRFGVMPLSGGRIYWFANLPVPYSSTDPSPHTTLLQAFKGWHKPIEAIIDATHNLTILRHPIVTRKPTPCWSVGNIVLLGDAAHPMTPDLGQGACQAIEDAVTLADSLLHLSSVREAVTEYQRRRYNRVAAITRTSYFQGKVAGWSNPLLCRIRNTAMRAAPQQVLDNFFYTLIAGVE